MVDFDPLKKRSQHSVMQEHMAMPKAHFPEIAGWHDIKQDALPIYTSWTRARAPRIYKPLTLQRRSDPVRSRFSN